MTARTLRVKVPGIPKGKGSTTRFPNGAVVQAKTAAGRKAYADWCVTVRSLAAMEWGEEPQMTGPVGLEVTFAMPRPKARRHDVWHVTTQDLDHLVRAVADELVGAKVMRDDCLVAEILARKLYAGPTGWTGADIVVRELTP